MKMMRLSKAGAVGIIWCALLLGQGVWAKLVEVVKVNHNIHLDIRYATKNNFAGKVVYPSAKCYLQDEAAKALAEVEGELEKLGFGLKVFDGYRPLSVQKVFWNIVADKFPNPAERENYVADPAKGSKHNRGTAVDLTLIDLKTGKELEMPSGYDDFSDKAHRTYDKMTSRKAKKNCKLLELVMEKHGFIGLPTEWWHFDFKGWEKYPISDVTFDELAKA